MKIVKRVLAFGLSLTMLFSTGLVSLAEGADIVPEKETHSLEIMQPEHGSLRLEGEYECQEDGTYMIIPGEEVTAVLETDEGWQADAIILNGEKQEMVDNKAVIVMPDTDSLLQAEVVEIAEIPEADETEEMAARPLTVMQPEHGSLSLEGEYERQEDGAYMIVPGEEITAILETDEGWQADAIILNGEKQELADNKAIIVMPDVNSLLQAEVSEIAVDPEADEVDETEEIPQAETVDETQGDPSAGINEIALFSAGDTITSAYIKKGSEIPGSIDVTRWDGDEWTNLKNWSEGVLGTTDGEWLFCANPEQHFKEGISMTAHNASEYYSEDTIKKLCGVLYYTDQVICNRLTAEQAYMIRQGYIWTVLNEESAWYTGGDAITVEYGNGLTCACGQGISTHYSSYFSEGLDWAEEHKDQLEASGVIYVNGDNQPLSRWTYEYHPTGHVTLKKSSANPDLTNGNSCYSFEDAQYGVYKDEACQNQVGTLTVNSNGESNTIELDVGSYYVKEIKAPKGYALDGQVYPVIVTEGATAKVEVEDVPQNDPVGILLGKIDADTTKDMPQGSASLEGAEFTVKYYSGYYDSDPFSQGVNPVRTWVLRTNKNGFCLLSETYKISGDDFYKSSGGTVTLPLGTITIQETKAPTGYKINEEIFVRQIISEGAAESVTTYNEPTIPENVIRGGVKIEKWDNETAKHQAQGGASLEGARFQIISQNDNAVTVDGRSYNKGEVVKTLTTDKTGTASTGERDLPYGDYLVKEQTPPTGYLMEGVLEQRFSIREDGVVINLNTAGTSIRDNVIRGGVRIEKWDNETAKHQAQGGASLEGARFQIISQNDKAVTVDGRSYNKGEVVKTLITDKTGTAVTGERDLPYGDYLVKEQTPPTGYLMKGVLEQRFSIREDGVVVNLNTAGTSIRDNVIRGGVKIEKWDNETAKREPQGSATLKDTKIQIISDNENPVVVNGKSYNKGEVVKILTTDKNGSASTGERELPYGNYIAKEQTPPEGYLMEGVTERKFSIREDGVLVNLNTADTAIRDNVIRGGVKLEKWDNETGEKKPQGSATLAGAVVDLINLNDYPVLVDGKTYTKDQVIHTYKTDENYTIQIAEDKLPYGRYKFVETKAPEGYNNTGKIEREFEITKNGQIVQMTTGSTAIRNDVIRGDVQLVKFEEDLDQEEDQKTPLDGIIFTFTSKTTGEVFEIVTDENGYASTKQLGISDRGNLVYDTYIVHEKNTPEGLDPVDDFEVTISKEGQTLYYILEDKQILAPIQLLKADATTGERIPVAGAEFQLLDADKEPVTMTTHYPDTVTYYTFETDENGSFILPEKLPAGVYYFREVNAPDGYLRGEDLKFEITEGYDWMAPMTVEYEDVPAMGMIEIKKEDAESGDPLEGAEFTVTAAEDIITPDGTLRASAGEPVDVITTDGDGKAKSKELFLGKYTVQETKQPTGYAVNKKTYEVELKYKGQETPLVVESLVVGNQPTVIIIDKKVSGTDQHLSGVKFAIWNKLMDVGDGEDSIDPGMSQKLAVKTARDGQARIEKLAPGTYCIQEVQGVPGYAVDPTIYEVTIGEDGRIDGEDHVTVTVENAETEIVETNAYDVETDTHTGLPQSSTTIRDTVSIENLQPGETYTLKGVIVNQENGLPIEPLAKTVGDLFFDRSIRSEVTFEATDSVMDVPVEFTFDSSEMDGLTLTVYEYLYQQDIEISKHTDLEDEKQQVTFPAMEIHTTAMDQDTQSHETYMNEAGGTTSITDTVENTGIVPGLDYTLKGVVMDQETGEPLLNGDREKIIAEKIITPEDSKITVDMEFVFDSSNLAGKSIVIFEYLYHNDEEIESHEDIDDKDQTVTFVTPEIHTTAIDQDTQNHQAYVNESTVIVDTVTYEGLADGENLKYILRGTPIDQETGEPLLNADGNQIWSEQEFTAEELAGTVDVTFELDTSALAGKSIVFYEYLYLVKEGGELPVAEHEDIDDEDQTVTFVTPEIHTTAIDQGTQSHQAYVNESAVIVDTVTYEGLADGEKLKYILRGTPIDQETGEPLLNADGNQIWSEQEFTAEELAGTVDVTFELDTSALAGKSIVFYEYLYLVKEGEKLPVAEHEDIEDEDQTVTFAAPEIHTTALGKDSGTHEVIAEEDTVIIDTVDYKGIVADGKLKYILRGTPMNKETGEPLLDADGNQIWEEREFTPTESDGSVEMEFTLDTSALEGKSIVFYEYLYLITENGELPAAEHEDIEDEDQTVYVLVPQPSSGEGETPKTGDDNNIVPVIGFACLAGATGTGAYLNKKRREKGEETVGVDSKPDTEKKE